MHPFLVCIDSDGTAFDTMTVKFYECFPDAITAFWGLEAIAGPVRDAIEFVNLYSKQRGINRWLALVRVFDVLEAWQGIAIPAAATLRAWTRRTPALTSQALRQEAEATGDPVLYRALAWNDAVNAAFARLVYSIPPFPLVRECLREISNWADIVVCSVAPADTLIRQWEGHDLARYTTRICGQEMGPKQQIIRDQVAGRYDTANVIMIGDAPGDLEAARANRVRFYPINPRGETASWEVFHGEIADAFRRGGYTPEREEELIVAFDALLPERPWWERQT